MVKNQPINAMNLTPESLIELDLQFFAEVAKNKVKYGLKNARYAKITETSNGVTYGSLIPLPGAVSLSISPNGELFEFNADDIVYYSQEVNNGYDGDFEIAEIPESFRTDILGDDLIDGVLYESSTQKGGKFALVFEFDGDTRARRFVLYYCTATRPTVSSSTKTTTIDVQTSSLTFSARPRPDNYLIKADSATSSSSYDAWFTAVHEKPTNEELDED